MRAVLLILCFIFSIAPGASPGHAQNRDRVALVIGNSAYRNVAALPNPQKDRKSVV